MDTPFRLAAAAAAAMILSVTCAAAAEDPVARGDYLVNGIMGCGNCHTPQGPGGPDMTRFLAGGMAMDEPVLGKVHVPNITQDRDTGIGAWSDAEIATAIRDGLRPDGSLIGPPMPSPLYRGISDTDLAAIIAYLRTVPALANAVPKSSYAIPLPPAYGPPVETVAEVPRDDVLAYGAYLAGPLGHCVECHTPMAAGGHPDFQGRLGAGGREFHGPWGTSVSSNITPAGPVADYSDAELKAAITTGMRPDGSRMMPPMGYGYYARMTNADLDALVAWIRTLPARE
ncbi:c-type cytochrome [Marinibaculum pumilum]|uniref:C-type cytochrome n=1 Tax=Marinibaculum pumilum TaxID=1766165 RepID=A0ABV7L3E3_9PROT